MRKKCDNVDAIIEAFKKGEWIETVELKFPDVVRDDSALRLEEVRKLSEFLKTNPYPFSELVLTGNKLENDDATLLADAIRHNHNLTSLKMINNAIGEEGALAIRDALAVNRSIVKIRIGGAEIGESTREAIRGLEEANKERQRQQKAIEEEFNATIYGGGGGWYTFIKIITESIENREEHSYPYAMLNKDQSISLFVYKEKEGTVDAFEKVLRDSDIVRQLDQHRKDEGVPILGNKEQLVEKGNYDPVTGITEYRINIEPEQLDALLKLNSSYQGYRNENSVLKLNKTFVAKPGVVRLFPVQQLEDGTMAVMADGCQVYEMPTVQLLHLLPDYDGKEKYFHWVPDEVSEKLSIVRFTIDCVYNAIFMQQGMLDEEQRFEQPPIVRAPSQAGGSVRVVAMDSDARDFYALYGNCSAKELENYQSLEVPTVLFLRVLKEHLMGSQEDVREEVAKNNTIERIDQMIGTELSRAPASHINNVERHIAPSSVNGMGL